MEMDLYAALGLEKPAETGGEGGAADGQPKEPVEDTGRDGAGPAEEGGEEGGAAGEPEGDGQPKEGPEVAEPAGEGEKKRQSRSKNARHAEARRTEDAVQKALREQEQRHQEELKALFRELGLKTGEDKPVESLEEYRAATAAQRARDLAAKLRSGDVEEKDLAALLGQESPELAALRQRVERMEQERQQAEQERRRQDFLRRTEAELEQIRAYDPSVQSLEDLPRLSRAAEFYAEVKAGKSYLEAYETVYRDEIEAKRTAAVRQETINRQRGKEHLSATPQRGSGAPAVPAEEARLYRQLMPGISEEEIRRHYARFKQT